jgi:hypothetical protein
MKKLPNKMKLVTKNCKINQNIFYICLKSKLKFKTFVSDIIQNRLDENLESKYEDKNF